MIFHSGGSLVWKKAACAEQVSCAKGCGAVGWAEISVCGEAGVGQRFERWALRGRRAVRRAVTLRVGGDSRVWECWHQAAV